MIDVTRQFGVFGLGVSGLAMTHALATRQIAVIAAGDTVSDRALDACEQDVVPVTAVNTDVVALEKFVADLDYVVATPGLPESHPLFGIGRRHDVEFVSEFDVVSALDGRPSVVITGTNGKTTVTGLVAHIVSGAGMHTCEVGNTDVPYVEAIADPTFDVFVVEASSFRLATTHYYRPKAAAWLNFAPDHLDVHESLQTYEEAKAQVFRILHEDQLAVGNRDDPVVCSWLARTAARTETFGSEAGSGAGGEWSCDETSLVSPEGVRFLDISDMSRSFPHDVSNALCASALARELGVSLEQCALGIRSFEHPQHRVQVVATINGVTFINDSKATAPHATIAALKGFDSVVLIAGGRNKGLSFDPLKAHGANVHSVVAIGEAAPHIAAVFGDDRTTIATSMHQAVEYAASLAGPGDVVLLSPACASFDQYGSYAERGEDFMNCVNEMVGTNT